MLMALAAGYTINKNNLDELPENNKNNVILVSSVFFVSYIGFTFLGFLYHDQFHTFHAGETVPGYILISLRLVLVYAFYVGISKTKIECKNSGQDVTAFLNEVRNTILFSVKRNILNTVYCLCSSFKLWELRGLLCSPVLQFYHSSSHLTSDIKLWRFSP
jgi:hypothetical protein